MKGRKKRWMDRLNDAYLEENLTGEITLERAAFKTFPRITFPLAIEGDRAVEF